MVSAANSSFVLYDRVWKGNANLEIAITQGRIGDINANTGNARIYVLNIQDIANNENDFERFDLNETVYTRDSGIYDGQSNLTFEFVNQENIIYLGNPLQVTEPTLHGFANGEIVWQDKPAQYVSVVLPEEVYRRTYSCTACGCLGDDCSCGEKVELSAEERTVTVLVKEPQRVQAVVTHESAAPPYITVEQVTGGDGEFLVGLPVTNGQISARVVGSFAPILIKDPYLGNYIVEQPAIYVGDNCFDRCVIEEESCENIGLTDGPHIGIDEHFTGRDTQDWNDRNIIISGNGVASEEQEYFSTISEVG